LEDGQLLAKSDCVAKVLAVIASALQCQTNPASRIHLLNTVRTSALMTQHLSAFFTRMPAEQSMARQRAFKRAIKVSGILVSNGNDFCSAATSWHGWTCAPPALAVIGRGIRADRKSFLGGGGRGEMEDGLGNKPV